MRFHAAYAGLVWLVAGCGAGGGSVGLPSRDAHTTSAKTAAVGIRIKVAPRHRVATSRARPAYFDPQTIALNISTDGALITSLPINATTCPVPAAGGDATCSLTATLPLGQHAFLFEAVSSGTDPTLVGPKDNSATVVPANITANGPNIIRVSLGGVLFALTLTLGSNGDVPGGAPLSIPVTVIASDLSGNQIIGSEPFVQDDGVTLTPITITTSDVTNAALHINGGAAAGSVRVTSPSDSVTLSYSGSTGVIATINGSFTPQNNAQISASSSVAFVGGGGFVPIVTTFAGDPNLAGNYTAIASQADGSGIVLAESNGDIITVSNSGVVGPRTSLATSGAGGEPVVVRSMALVGGHVIGLGDNNAAATSSSTQHLYGVDLTTPSAPKISAPVTDNVDQFFSFALLTGIQAVTSDGKLWVAPPRRFNSNIAAPVSIYSVDTSLNVVAHPIADTAAGATDTVSGVCPGPGGNSVGFLETGPQSGGTLDLSGNVLGEYKVPGGYAAISCVTASDGAEWLTPYNSSFVTPAGADIAEILRVPLSPANVPLPIVPVTNISGFDPPAYFANGQAVAGTTLTNANDIYWVDNQAFGSPVVNFVTFDVVAHTATVVPINGPNGAADVPEFLIVAPDGNIWYPALFSPDLVHIQVHP